MRWTGAPGDRQKVDGGSVAAGVREGRREAFTGEGAGEVWIGRSGRLPLIVVLVAAGTVGRNAGHTGLSPDILRQPPCHVGSAHHLSHRHRRKPSRTNSTGGVEMSSTRARIDEVIT